LFAHPLGLLALLAVPAVVALHLYRRRFEPRAVSALFLWRVEDSVPLAGRRREPLATSPSFWCEVLASFALALAFAGPRGSCSGGAGEHLVVVLDASASMGARAGRGGAGAGERSVRDAGLELVAGRIDELARGSRVTIVRSGTRPSLLAGPAAFPAEASQRLEEWRPLAASHDLQPALVLALELAGSGRVLVVTDRFEPEAWPRSVELAALGEPADNLAITHATRRRELGEDGAPRDRVFLTVTSFAGAARDVLVRASAAGPLPGGAARATLAQRELAIAPRQRAHLSFELPEGTGAVAVELPPDALAIDDRVLLAPPAARTVALHSALPEEDARALGLERWLDAIPGSVEAGSAEAAHLVLSRGAQGGRASWCFSLEPQGAERRDMIGPFLGERGSALLEGTTLEGMVWSADPGLVLAGAPLVSAGNTVLLSEERAAGRVVWRANLDPARSSLQRSPDWPILLANMAELRRDALPGPERTNLHVGETFRYRPGAEVERAAGEEGARYVVEGPLATPRSSSREVPALEELVVDGLEEPGLYRVTFAGAPVAEFALSFVDAAESDLAPASSGRREAELESARLESELSWLELALIGAALALVALDWIALERAGRYVRGEG
jgi:hypothetical protein